MKRHAGSGAKKSKVAVPADFIHAREDLVALVKRSNAGEVTDRLVREEVPKASGDSQRIGGSLDTAFEKQG